MNDEKIICLYFDRNEEAIRASMDAYSGYCRKIAFNILKNEEDVEEAVSETWMRAWNSIPPQRPMYLRLFLGRITRNLALSMLRAKLSESRGGGEVTLVLEELSECIGEDSNLEQTLQFQELSKCVSEFLKSQPKNNRIIFLRRYFYLESSKEIGQRMGMNCGNVRMILSRTRKALAEYLKKEGYFS